MCYCLSVVVERKDELKDGTWKKRIICTSTFVALALGASCLPFAPHVRANRQRPDVRVEASTPKQQRYSWQEAKVASAEGLEAGQTVAADGDGTDGKILNLGAHFASSETTRCSLVIAISVLTEGVVLGEYPQAPITRVTTSTIFGGCRFTVS